MYKLELCPKCGSGKLVKGHTLGTHRWFVECEDCHYCGKTKLFLFRAIRSWNREATKVCSH